MHHHISCPASLLAACIFSWLWGEAEKLRRAEKIKSADGPADPGRTGGTKFS